MKQNPLNTMPNNEWGMKHKPQESLILSHFQRLCRWADTILIL